MPLINAHESLWDGGGWTGSSGDDCRDPLHVVQRGYTHCLYITNAITPHLFVHCSFGFPLYSYRLLQLH
jgi:hypothetical protein